MVMDAWPETCLRAGQSRVTITRVVPLLCGVKNSVQVRDEPPVIILKPKWTGSFSIMYIKKSFSHIEVRTLC